MTARFVPFVFFAFLLTFCALVVQPVLAAPTDASTTDSPTPAASPASGGATASTCDAPANPTGAPCGGDGPASQGNTSETPQGAGNPINVITGNKYQREVDMAPLPGVLGLELVRHYNSASSGTEQLAGLLGRGWKLSYETRLQRRGGLLYIFQADGTVIAFGRDLFRPGRFTPSRTAHGSITARAQPAGTDYVWTWRNGRRLTFDERGHLLQIQVPSGEFVSLRYDARGRLVRVTDPQGRELHLHMPDKRALAENIERTPPFAGVHSIDTPVGRFTYEYGAPSTSAPVSSDGSITRSPANGSRNAARAPIESVTRANLVKISLPTDYSSTPAHAWTARGVSHSSVSRLYHYEDVRHPTLLTGISVQGQGSDGRILLQRVATWAYDAPGRARLSVKGEPARFVTGHDGKALTPRQQIAGTGLEQVTLAWPRPGETLLINSLGQQTVYRTATIAGEHRILDVRGPGCARCGPGNVRYSYDAAGSLIEQVRLSDAGAPTESVTMVRDALGRVTRVGTRAWHRGRPQAPVWKVRYEYDGSDGAGDGSGAPADRPVLIARPSVVPGKEHQTRIAYNDRGQVTQITETGYQPMDTDGHPLALSDPAAADRAASIARSTHYRYDIVNGRSVLREIDGPLANGPANSPQDSDITRVRWDAHGNWIEQWTAPGGLHSVLAHDPGTGRIVDVRGGDGLHTHYRYDARGQLIALSRAGEGWQAPPAQVFRYDALGQLTEEGSGEGDAFTPRSRQAFDVAGNLLWRADTLGILNQQQYNTESDLLQTGRYSNRMADVHHLSYDAQRRLVGIQDSRGRGIRLAYDDAGRAMPTVKNRAANVDAQRSSPEAAARIRSHAAAALPQQLIDDFGRLVAMRSPDTGMTVWRFDAADRLIGSCDALGNRAEYVHDHASRIARQIIVERTTGQAVTTSWRYQGPRLVAIDHPTQSETYRYDAQGRLAHKASRTTTLHGAVITSQVNYHWDSEGRLAATTLADGSTQRYVRNPQGQIVAVTRERVQTRWLQWLLPSQIVVDNIARDLIGLSRFTTGNGIEAVFQRSRSGVLARVVYRRASPSQGNADAVVPAVDDGVDPARARQSNGNDTAAIGEGQGVPLTQAASSRGQASNGQVANGAIPAARSTAATQTPGAPPQISPRLPGALGLPPALQALFDERYLWDARGNLLYRENKAGATISARYAYDTRDRLIATVAQTGKAQEVSRYAWDARDNRVLAQQGSPSQADLATGTRKTAFVPGTHRLLSGDMSAPTIPGRSASAPQADYDATGLPLSIDAKHYDWDALGQLRTVRRGAAVVTDYVYNHRGERIAKYTREGSLRYLYEDGRLVAELDAAGRLRRQYLYLADQPIAALDTPGGEAPAHAADSALTRIARDLVTILRVWTGHDAPLVWLHANHLGAIEVASDTAGRVIWRARYAPFGEMTQVGNGGDATSGQRKPFALNLRLPGQYADSESGLYYNGHRYYDPGMGRYLTPDPLGMPDGPNPYLYVRGNPLRYVDPSGLILFAFDGTGNSRQPGPEDSLSNVVKFLEAYDEDANGKKFYITGIRTTDENMPVKGNTWTGYGFDQRVNLGFKFLNDYMAESNGNDVLNIDVVGFSRGAAEARVWLNQLAAKLDNGAYTSEGKTRCLNLRFEGLWDTVPHLGLANGDEAKYDFAIPEEVRYAAHAVALNEFRGGPANFNGRSIMNAAGQPNSSTRVELGFIGSHSDIGGGYGTGDLSDVALVWMLEQARKQGIVISDSEVEKNAWNSVSDPVLHDRSNNLSAPGKAPFRGDREFVSVDGKTSVSMSEANVGGKTSADANSNIRFYSDWCGTMANPVVGMVDMTKYAAWLKAYGVDIPTKAPVENSCGFKAT